MTIESPGQFWKDYELIDSGNFEKLERFGSCIMARPEPKALWEKSLSEGEWNKMMHTRFKTGAGFGKAGKEDSGTWERHKKMDDQWHIRYRGGQEGLDFSPPGPHIIQTCGRFPRAILQLGIHIQADKLPCGKGAPSRTA